ncbi:MAG: IS66 family insertion sequence element accessory protein TnpB [bacterium]
MLSLPPSVRIFLCTRPVDMRLSFDRLAALAEQVLEESPFTGHLFVYVNRQGDRVKILYWDRVGFAIWYRRLERGTYRFPFVEGPRVEMNSSELALILEGIDLSGSRRQKRYARAACET